MSMIFKVFYAFIKSIFAVEMSVNYLTGRKGNKLSQSKRQLRNYFQFIFK